MRGEAPLLTLAVVSISTLICADWGKARSKRVAYVADIAARSIRRLHAPTTFAGLLANAQGRSGSVVLGFDVPLGLPMSLLKGKHGLLSEASFIELLDARGADTTFFTPVTTPAAWSPKTPFFVVPRGGKALFTQRAQAFGVELRRDIDKQTKGNALFITSGIPGTVGSSVVSLWPEIAAARRAGERFSLWPFDGPLHHLTAGPGVVVAEIYPRAAYATALTDGTPATRAPLGLSKTDPRTRSSALDELRQATWIKSLGVTLHDMPDALASEDAFDAMFTAAALLRCELEGMPHHAQLASPTIEGGILGTGSINLALRERAYVISAPGSTPAAAPSPKSRPLAQPRPCPIAGCTHIFKTRGGWDAHVASPKKHPLWHPTVANEHMRKQLFQAEFPRFFT